MTDEQIIELYFARDERAISETANAHGAYCFGVAMRILKSHMDSEECVNDTWLRAWNTIPLKRPSILRTYLAHIIRNVAISRYRRAYAEKRSIPSWRGWRRPTASCSGGATSTATPRVSSPRPTA